MKRFSIRSLIFCMIAGAAGFSLLRLAYERYHYHVVVEPAWKELPIASQRVSVSDDNDIEISFDLKTMELKSSEQLEPATGFDGLDFSGSLSEQYDLRCGLGEFRVIFTGTVWDKIPDGIRGSRSAFGTLRHALTLTPATPMAQPEIWRLRQAFGYAGSDVRIQHFESSTKFGFIVDQGGRMSLELFDPTGDYSIVVRPISTGMKDWTQLASRLTLVEVTQ